MRVLVTGGRDYQNYYTVKTILDKYGQFVLIQGGATGADALAVQWANARNSGLMERGLSKRILVDTYKAKWDDLSYPDARIMTNRWGKKYDAQAGHRRNKDMLDIGKPDVVLAFKGGAGTRDMIKQATEAGVRVFIIQDKEC